ncbi:MAG: EMC3/TMCO1 family protein [Thermoplasmata archaeon]|nr:EMC3/TMCO1 family protein [Thermoplasmata archaeon]
MAEPQPAPPMGNVSSQMLMMMMIFGTMFIMFIPSLRDGVGNIAGLVLEPIIGFNGAYPVLTVLFAGIGLVTFSSAVRHYFINWIESAEKQFKMKDFNKKLRDARMSGNDAEVKRLTQKQLQMSTEQMSSMMDQMKPMMFTMIFLIATFAFIGTFIGDIPGATLSVPWADNVDMNAALSTSTCCAFSNWMLVYMLISMSVAQVIQRVFKLYSFNKMLKDPESLTKPSATKAEPEYEEPEDEETDDEEEEYLIIDDDEAATVAGEEEGS